MTQGYEYIRISSDLGDLDELNNLSVNGWHVVYGDKEYLLLERPLTEEGRRKTLEYYKERYQRKLNFSR
jgi:hypothetical protein